MKTCALVFQRDIRIFLPDIIEHLDPEVSTATDTHPPLTNRSKLSTNISPTYNPKHSSSNNEQQLSMRIHNCFLVHDSRKPTIFGADNGAPHFPPRHDLRTLPFECLPLAAQD